MSTITDTNKNQMNSCSTSHDKSGDINALIKSNAISLMTYIHFNDTTTIHTNESSGNNILSFDSNNSLKVSRFLKDVGKGVKGRPAFPNRPSISKPKFEDDMKKIGIDTNSLINDKFRLSINLGEKIAEKITQERHECKVASRSRQNRFKLRDGMATIDIDCNMKEKHWEMESPSKSKCKCNLNPMISFFSKKKFARKASTSEHLKKAIDSMNIIKEEPTTNLSKKKQKAYMNILNLIYNNHIKKKDNLA